MNALASSTSRTEPLIRIKRGQARNEELAALTAILLACAAVPAPWSMTPTAKLDRPCLGWRRSDWRVHPRFICTHSWQAGP
jgi:hypothetical protein